MAEVLQPLADGELVAVLNRIEILGELNEPPYRTRILTLRDLGECGEIPQSCPRERLYVTVSTFDEAPDFAAYRLPDSYGWTFIRWGSTPDQDGINEFMSIVVSRRLASANRDERRLVSEIVEIRVNPWKGTFKAIEGK